ncbi:hypothetical protein BL250_09455 [Erwinia sp. OLTSP20]|uniref:DUF1158 family protein n=1 Tax=unclassified Erwinia TaxID=2622719 RepID=UPI000C19784F|nr:MULTISPECIES: DUF1158 family protein [unclassified Erwinia]PIJ50749.1 hypothetical protein BV501_07135 [Erwinia sp. OAMSP11]PIJ75418.1 hypothetical protein BK416_01930 [Erwinia sp. OLSSP12]PIJ81916.1 hypothetical protein BLD47_07480 [Erwinia sp. OLCASP19]PIJ84571.1 hypothetical protein BLD46_07570 [Erwinia sp. OLMTSP26]PIJ86918.1 hypothetical protein BLD49_07340 [Erwinia sp. OLMDSP33]
MKTPFELFLMPLSTLLLGMLSALLLPAPQFGLSLSHQLMTYFHLSDINQLYTLVFCCWFLLLGASEFFIIRFIWRRFIKV